MYLIGIDDAGRGPIIGPMILAGVLIKKEDEKSLKDIGAKDSKLISHSERIRVSKLIKEKIRDMLPIWNVNSLAERFIELFLEFKEDYLESIRRTIKDKQYLIKKLNEIDYIEPFESNANFVFCKTRISARKIAEHLFNNHKILIRFSLNQKDLTSDAYIRIGVRTKEDNDKLILALKEIESL